MSFPITVPQPNWEKMLSDLVQMSQGGAGVAQGAGQSFIDQATKGFQPGQQQPIPNPQFQTVIPGKPGFTGYMSGNQGRTINHPVQQYQGQKEKSFLDSLLGRNPNRPAPGTVVLPGPVQPEPSFARMVKTYAAQQQAKQMAGQGQPTPGNVVPDPVQMDQMPPELAQQVAQRQGTNVPQNSQQQRQTNQPMTSFADMATKAAQIKADGGELPFQDMKQEDIVPSFNNSPGTGGQRYTPYDTEKIYAVVRSLDADDYAQLESYTTRSDLVEAGADTALDLLEENQIYMSDPLEERFKAGIGSAMEDWYANQVKTGGSTDMTSYMMGVTQFALALIEASGETGSQARGDMPVEYTGSTGTPQQTQQATQFSGPNGLPTEEEFLLAAQEGRIPKEFIEGYLNFMELNEGANYDDFIAGGGQ